MNKRRTVLLALGAGSFTATFHVFAQMQKKAWRIGMLIPDTASSSAERLEYLRAGLKELGYVENQNLIFLLRYADGSYERLPALAADLIVANVDLLVTFGTICAKEAQRATKSVPIVMLSVGDPVATGLVASLARPGGNATGLALLGPELMLKRMELIHETSPRTNQVAMLFNPGNPSNGNTSKVAEAAATTLKMGLQKYAVKDLDEIKSAFAAMKKKGVSAVVFTFDPVLMQHYSAIAILAERERLPAFGPAEFAKAGGLIGSGSLLSEIYRRGAIYVDKILKGAKPGDLPVEQPSKFELVVNIKTAKAIGLTIPQSILVRADKVIE